MHRSAQLSVRSPRSTSNSSSIMAQGMSSFTGRLGESDQSLQSRINSRTTSRRHGGALTDAFKPGKRALVRMLSNDKGKYQILANTRQATINTTPPDISGVEVDDSVQGIISDVHKDNVLLNPELSNVWALLSLKNLVNRRGSTVARLTPRIILT